MRDIYKDVDRVLVVFWRSVIVLLIAFCIFTVGVVVGQIIINYQSALFLPSPLKKAVGMWITYRYFPVDSDTITQWLYDGHVSDKKFVIAVMMLNMMQRKVVGGH